MIDIQEHMRWLRDAGGRTNMEALRAIEALLARAEAAESERDRLKAALVEVEGRLNCRGNPDVAHYCPNCDNSLHKASEIARKALGGDAS